MEAKEWRIDNFEHVKGHIGLQFRQLHRVAEPGAFKCLPAEGVTPGPGETVPIGDGEAQVILHPAA